MPVLYAFTWRCVGVYGARQKFWFEIYLEILMLCIKLCFPQSFHRNLYHLNERLLQVYWWKFQTYATISTEFIENLLYLLSLKYLENDDVVKLYGAQCDFPILFEWLNQFENVLSY